MERLLQKLLELRVSETAIIESLGPLRWINWLWIKPRAPSRQDCQQKQNGEWCALHKRRLCTQSRLEAIRESRGFVQGSFRTCQQTERSGTLCHGSFQRV